MADSPSSATQPVGRSRRRLAGPAPPPATTAQARRGDPRAARAFDERGYHNTSLDDIAAALGVTKPTIYYYVANKEQLLFECFLAGLEPIRERAAPRRGHARHGPRPVARGRPRLRARHRLGVRLVHGARRAPGPGTELSAQVRALKSEIDRGIRRLLQAGIADGSIAVGDPKLAAFAIAGALNWIAHWYRAGRTLTSEDVAEAFVQFLEQGLAPRAAVGSDRGDGCAGTRASAPELDESLNRRHPGSLSCAAKRTRRTLRRLLSRLPSPALPGRTHDRLHRHRRRPPHADRRVPGRVRSASRRPSSGTVAARRSPGGCGPGARRDRRSHLRLRAAGRPRPGAGPPGRRRRGHRAERPGDDGQQDVRLRHEGRDDGGRPDPRRLCARRAGGRPRVDDQRAVPDAEGARAVTAWATREISTTCSTTACRARGTARRWAASPTRPRPSTASRARTRMRSPPSPCAARSAPSKDGEFVAEIAPVTVKTRKGEQVVATDETPFQLDIDKIPHAEARVRQGRHGHRRLLLVDLRRRGRS